VEFLEGDLFEPIGDREFDLVVSNPPYLAKKDSKDLPAELKHEPELALFGGEDGYRILEQLALKGRRWLKPGGWLLVELDPAQVKVVTQWLNDSGLGEIEILRDLAGRDRVIAARRSEGVEATTPTSVPSTSKDRVDPQEVVP
jgi:release factor glutamine methyltransferase